MTDGYAGRVIVYDGEWCVERDTDRFDVGDTLEVIRGNGMREGERMGTATVVGLEVGGRPYVCFDGELTNLCFMTSGGIVNHWDRETPAA